MVSGTVRSVSSNKPEVDVDEEEGPHVVAEHEEPGEPAVDGHDDLGEGEVEGAVAKGACHGHAPDHQRGAQGDKRVEAEAAHQGDVMQDHPEWFLVPLS